jgi:hypothetical protein
MKRELTANILNSGAALVGNQGPDSRNVGLGACKVQSIL